MGEKDVADCINCSMIEVRWVKLQLNCGFWVATFLSSMSSPLLLVIVFCLVTKTQSYRGDEGRFSEWENKREWLRSQLGGGSESLPGVLYGEADIDIWKKLWGLAAGSSLVYRTQSLFLFYFPVHLYISFFL